MTLVPFLILILTASTVLCFVLSSWITIWVMLEMNTLAFCSFLSTSHIKKKYSPEMSMKYFVIQSVSSSLLVFVSMTMKVYENTSLVLLSISTVSLAIKMAASPFHSWFVDIVKNIEWKSSTLLMTWQKLAPVFLLIYQIKLITLPFLLLSALVGTTMQMNKTKLMEIMAFSSIFNLSWMMLAVSTNTKILILFSGVYWLSVLIVMLMLTKSKKSSINTESIPQTEKKIYFLALINMGGIPPTAGFLAKWATFNQSLSNKLVTLTSILLVISSVNLYIYLRMLTYISSKGYEKKQKEPKKTSKPLMVAVATMNTFPLTMLAIYSKCLNMGLFW